MLRFTHPRCSAAALALAALLAIGAGGALRLETPAGEAIEVGPPRPGETLILHFWATWCAPCEDDLVALQAALAACGGGGPTLFAVNAGEDMDDIAAFARQPGLKLPILLDPGGRVWRSTGAIGLPANLYWTREGRRVEVGPKSPDQWREALGAAGCGRDRPGRDISPQLTSHAAP